MAGTCPDDSRNRYHKIGIPRHVIACLSRSFQERQDRLVCLSISWAPGAHIRVSRQSVQPTGLAAWQNWPRLAIQQPKLAFVKARGPPRHAILGTQHHHTLQKYQMPFSTRETFGPAPERLGQQQRSHGCPRHAHPFPPRHEVPGSFFSTQTPKKAFASVASAEGDPAGCAQRDITNSLNGRNSSPGLER